jgi:hypothetical protein
VTLTSKIQSVPLYRSPRTRTSPQSSFSAIAVKGFLACAGGICRFLVSRGPLRAGKLWTPYHKVHHVARYA